jgi:hypothetical protein
MHKFMGVRPRSSKHMRCPICTQFITKNSEFLWWHGERYHKDCYEKEFEKPLHLRFRKK